MKKNLLEALELRVLMAAGDLDHTFGDNGSAIVEVFSISSPVYSAVQRDGKIVVAGAALQGPDADTDFLVLRLTADGKLDSSFGTDGKTFIDFGGSDDVPVGIAVQPDGGIVIAGNASHTYAQPIGLDIVGPVVARLGSTGQLDSTFGHEGKSYTFHASSLDFARAMTLDQHGNVLIAGDEAPVDSGGKPVEHPLVGIIKFRADGSPDPFFGNNGLVKEPIGPIDSAEVKAIAVDFQNRILIGKIAGTNSVAFARLTEGGSIDVHYGVAGVRIAHVSALPSITDLKMVVGEQGQIYAAVGDTSSRIIHITSDGAYDKSFQRKSTPGVGVPLSMAVQNNGRILVAGPEGIFRVNANGTLDKKFGTHPTPTGILTSGALSLQDDGKIVFVGTNGINRIIAHRLENNPVRAFATLGKKGGLIINGSKRDDLITVVTDDADAVTVTRNGVSQVFAGSLIRRVIVNGGDGNDFITLAGFHFNSTITDLARRTKIFGGGGSDVLVGTAGPDIIDAGRRNDLVFAGDGNDTIFGGPGDDRLDGEVGDDVIFGGWGDDRISSSFGTDKLIGQEGNDEFAVNAGATATSVFGGLGNDTLRNASTSLGKVKSVERLVSLLSE